jgi:hypothetical protein
LHLRFKSSSVSLAKIAKDSACRRFINSITLS